MTLRRHTYRGPGFRGWLGWTLRKYADRYDPDFAPRGTHWSFTFERGAGMKFRDDGRGCKVWYIGNPNYQRAHDEADNPVCAPARADIRFDMRADASRFLDKLNAAGVWTTEGFQTGGVVYPPKDDDSVMLELSPGRSTTLRPGETPAAAVDRLMEGRDL